MRSILFLAILLLVGRSCFADFAITDASSTLDPIDTASATLLNGTAKGSGLGALPGNFHEETYYNNAWVGKLSTTTGVYNDLIYQTGTAPELAAGFTLWNLTDVSSYWLNQSTVDTNLLPDRWNKEAGLKKIELYTSVNPNDPNAWTLLETVDNIPIANNSDTYLYDSNDPTSENYFSRPFQYVFSTPVMASGFKVRILETHESTSPVYAGLAEISFQQASVAAVPEPSSICLVSASIIIAGFYKRSRSKRKNVLLQS